MKKIVIILITSLSCSLVNAQNVGIGNTRPNTSAVLDVSSAIDCLLIPGMRGSG